MNGRLVIDADSHKCENPVIFLDYVDAAWRSRISFVRDRWGEQRIQILDRLPGETRPRARLFLQPEGWGKGTYRPYHPESTLGGLFNRVRLEHMDREGIDHQVVYGSVALAFASVADPELAVALCRAYNDYIRDDCAPHPRRLHPVGVLPLQDPAEAVAELRRCVDALGMIAVMIPPNLPQPHPSAPAAFPDVRVPRHLSHADFLPIFAEAERLDVALGIHGAPGLQLAGGAGDQLDTFTLVHAFANRDMQQMALAKLIFDGVMEAFPRLRFGFLEAGCGWLPDFLQSLHDHWQRRIRDFDPTLEPSPAAFLRELARERGGASRTGRLRRAARLLQMLFAPSAEAAPADELERFRYEHPKLARDPREYVWRGQVFLTAAPDDPAPGYLAAAMGDPGIRVCCFAVDYGHWDATLEDCVAQVTENERISPDAAAAVLHENALRLYGKRLLERVA
jgi:predicted TIM-barrel fold metal-dependent hydrolase